MASIRMEGIVKEVQSMADDMASQMEKNAFQSLNEGLEKHNRTVPGNPPFSADAFLQALDMIEIDFSDDDPMKPNLPTLVMHPDLAKKAKEEESAMTDEEKKDFEKKMGEIINRKFKDYMDREGKRKIVD